MVDHTTASCEAPWVTELLRDITLDEAFIPVWRYADDYHPSEESMGIAMSILSPIERKLVDALYKHDVSLGKVYAELSITPSEAANMLDESIRKLRNPCVLRIALKGFRECEAESRKLKDLQIEDVLLVGIETLSIPAIDYNAYAKVGIKTIEQLAFFLDNAEAMRAIESDVPQRVRVAAHGQLRVYGLWEQLYHYMKESANSWQRELGVKALSHGKDERDIPYAELVSKALNLITMPEKEVLYLLYRHRASERLASRILHAPDERIEGLHRSAEQHLREVMLQLK